MESLFYFQKTLIDRRLRYVGSDHYKEARNGTQHLAAIGYKSFLSKKLQKVGNKTPKPHRFIIT